MTAVKRGTTGDRKRLFVIAGAGAVAAALAIVSLTGGRSSPATAAEHVAVHASSSAVPPEARSAEPVPVLPLEERLEPPVDDVSSPSASVVATPPVAHGGHRVLKPANSGSAKDAERPTHADPNAVINPFE
jgi:hypothetical protein